MESGIRLRTPPDDYEARVNSVLRYSERFNQRIGIEYWLQNIVNFERDLVYQLFDEFQKSFKIKDIKRADKITRHAYYISIAAVVILV